VVRPQLRIRRARPDAKYIFLVIGKKVLYFYLQALSAKGCMVSQEEER